MTRFRPHIDKLAAYVPGEQPRESGWIKLNTNENPYPPSPQVREALHAQVDRRLQIYPEPLGTSFRQAAAGLWNHDADSFLPGNGSDEILTMLFRAFLDPGDVVAFPYPSYILYETLAEIQDASPRRLLLNDDWTFAVAESSQDVQSAKMVIVPNPNSPSGTLWTNDELLQLLPDDGVLVLDGAYADFADHADRFELLDSEVGDRIIYTRTLSKSYSLAGLRFGFAVARPEVICGLRKVKDSYNCDSLSIAGATAAIGDQQWMIDNVAKIRRTRARLTSDLAELGFVPTPSQANFVWCTHPSGEHQRIYEQLKARKILVRYMRFPEVRWARHGLLDGLRITVGTDDEIDGLCAALREIATA